MTDKPFESEQPGSADAPRVPTTDETLPITSDVSPPADPAASRPTEEAVRPQSETSWTPPANPVPPALGHGYNQANFNQPNYSQPNYGQPNYGQPNYSQPGHPTALAVPRRSRGMVAAVLVGALIVGGGAGVASSALYNATLDTQATTSATSGQPISSRSEATDGSTEAVATKVLPSVVEISVTSSQGAGSGSGVILNDTGRILTNNHVVEGAGQGGQIQVAFSDGSTAAAEVVGTDPVTDSAIIQAQDVSGLTPISVGTSADLQVGQSVVAIGSPFGLSSTVTEGIVSALDRPVNVGQDTSGQSITYPAIQTDAAINPGNSGGALVDMNGNLVGINSSIRTSGSSMTGEQSGSIGLGFAIPIDELLPIADQIVAGQTPTHARLGVTVGNVTQQTQPGTAPAALSQQGAELGEVTSGSGAAKAGLQAGDVVTKLDDHMIQDADTLVAMIRTYRPNDKVTVTYLRNGEEHTAQVTLQSDETTN